MLCSSLSEVSLFPFIHLIGPLHDGMLCKSLGGVVIFLSLQNFIAPALDEMHCLPSKHRREAIRACKVCMSRISLRLGGGVLLRIKIYKMPKRWVLAHFVLPFK